MQVRIAGHDETPFNVSFTSPEKVRSMVFSHLESLKKCKRRLHWGTFFENSLVSSKRGKLAPKRCLFKTILMSVTQTRSLGNIFNFKESEKSLTMDSQPFSRFNLLSLKKYKIYLGELSL
jgi:hypothetical protein